MTSTATKRCATAFRTASFRLERLPALNPSEGQPCCLAESERYRRLKLSLGTWQKSVPYVLASLRRAAGKCLKRIGVAGHPDVEPIVLSYVARRHRVAVAKLQGISECCADSRSEMGRVPAIAKVGRALATRISG